METAISKWKNLYIAGGVSAVAVVVLVPIQMAVFLIWPLPETVTGWYSLFHQNWLVGLLDMDLLLIVDYFFMGMIFLALWPVLRQTDESLTAIALTLELLGIASYFASTVAFEMLSLSNQYASATTDEERFVLLAAGEVMLATWEGTAFNISYIITAIALLLVSYIMILSTHFNKATAYTGIVLGIMSLVPPTAGKIGMILSILSLVPMVIWLVFIARRFFLLGSSE
jgi:hypothetical protein